MKMKMPKLVRIDTSKVIDQNEMPSDKIEYHPNDKKPKETKAEEFIMTAEEKKDIQDRLNLAAGIISKFETPKDAYNSLIKKDKN